MSDRPVLALQPRRDKRARAGHPWIFADEVVSDPGHKVLAPGTLVTLRDSEGGALGVASFNRHSLIVARRFDADAATSIDTGFFAERLRRAMAWRRHLCDVTSARLLNGEADGVPGLILDRFGDCVVVQANSAGADRLLGEITEAVRAVLDPALIVGRLDSPLRKLEGLEMRVEVLHGTPPREPLVLTENGLDYLVDVMGGQKTGWFHDQRNNRAFVACLADGARVLDVFSHSGGFGIAAAVAGAVKVVAIDQAEPALALAAAAAARNGVEDRFETVKAGAFAELERRLAAGQRFELVICDPPAFAKSRKDVPQAFQAYRKLVRLAAKLVTPAGFLVMCSCSHHIDRAKFAEAVSGGLVRAGRSGRILRTAGAAPDHPVHPLIPETDYLKTAVLQLD